jgi:hypothetical protein
MGIFINFRVSSLQKSAIDHPVNMAAKIPNEESQVL